MDNINGIAETILGCLLLAFLIAMVIVGLIRSKND